MEESGDETILSWEVEEKRLKPRTEKGMEQFFDILDAADSISRARGSEGSRSQSRSSVSDMSKSRIKLRQKAEVEKNK